MSVEVTLQLPEDIIQRYETMAKLLNRTTNELMVLGLEDAIEELEYEQSLIPLIEDIRSGKEKTYSMEQLKAKLGLSDDQIDE